MISHLCSDLLTLGKVTLAATSVIDNVEAVSVIVYLSTTVISNRSALVSISMAYSSANHCIRTVKRKEVAILCRVDDGIELSRQQLGVRVIDAWALEISPIDFHGHFTSPT